MKMIVLVASMLLLSGCGVDEVIMTDEERHEARESESATDQCKRAELFEMCLINAPQGPDKTKYNDWDEVIEVCGRTAYWQSQRIRKMIPEQCRGS